MGKGTSMSSSIFNKAKFVTLAAAGVMLVAAANGASAHGFGGGGFGGGHGGGFGHGGGNGGVHFDHIVVRGGDHDGRGDHGGRYNHGDGDRRDNRHSDRDERSRRGSANGNTGVYCPSCNGPVVIGNRPSGNTSGSASANTNHTPRADTPAAPAPVPVDPEANHKG